MVSRIIGYRAASSSLLNADLCHHGTIHRHSIGPAEEIACWYTSLGIIA